MADNKNKNQETVIPKSMAELEWVWVLGQVTEKKDSIFVIEMDEKDNGGRRRIVPVFETRDDAAKLKPKLCQHQMREYTEQSIRLSEIGRFAAMNNLEIMLLDESGAIMAHMEATIEQVSLH